MTRMKAALAVIDMQEDFCEPNGSLAVKDGRSTATVINELLDWPGFVVKVGTCDYHPQDHISFASNHPGTQPYTSSHTIISPSNATETQTTLLWPDHCVKDTTGAELIPELHKHKLSDVVRKGEDKRVESYSGFGPPFRNPTVGMSKLDAILTAAAVTHVFVVGLAYDFCVKSTAIDAVEHGYKTFVIEDGTKAVMQDETSLAKTRSDLQKAGVEVVSLEAELLRELRQP
ncbi:Putative isochorismatase [Septoria linicola]|uniref:nicotinamidase n=1 Tax=Septoria linicola TaxID=215465 RepID=A0A9Q9AML8_9PEZI|nr:putative isochorismatase [Septoria linicola]USW49210.1 Putative isochorismatase [Septoria linicola]